MSSNPERAHADVAAHPGPAESAERYDPYLPIHKAIRAMAADTLLRLGRLDPDDEQEMRGVIAQVRQAVALGEAHLEAENTFVHPAMEARAPGSTRRTADDHVTHGESLARLSAGCDELERSGGPARTAAALCLYRRFALFMADDLIHMHAEETENNAVLWATHTDAEIIRIVEALVASIPMEKKAIYMRWMLMANAPSERIKILQGVRSSAPPEQFSRLVESLTAHLPGAERGKLLAALG